MPAFSLADFEVVHGNQYRLTVTSNSMNETRSIDAQNWLLDVYVIC